MEADPNKSDLQSIARVVKSNGTKGELLAELFIPPDEIEKDEPVYIVFDGLPVPFFIENSTQRGSRKALLRLTDIESLEDADELAGKYIYTLAQPDEDDSAAETLEGWIVYDTEGKKAGVVTGFLDIPENPCLIVDHEGDEIYIPFHENLIAEYDEAGERIVIDIPSGLI